MYLPTLFDQDFLDDFFDDPFFRNSSKDMRKLEKKMNGRKERNLMRTDVKETADAYEMKVELPGFKKENIKISLENGFTLGEEKAVEVPVGDDPAALHKEIDRLKARIAELEAEIAKVKAEKGE